MPESESPQAPPSKPEIKKDFADHLFAKFMNMVTTAHEAGINTTAAQNEARRQLTQVLVKSEPATKSGEED